VFRAVQPRNLNGGEGEREDDAREGLAVTERHLPNSFHRLRDFHICDILLLTESFVHDGCEGGGYIDCGA